VTLVWVWLALSVFGICVSAFLTRESARDLQALGSDHNGRHTAAMSRFSREFLRVTVHAGYIIGGVSVLSDWNGPFLLAALLWGNTVLVINSLIDARARRLTLFSRRGIEPDIEH
jgi:hypothetical protein